MCAPTDVTVFADAEALVTATYEAFGRIDVVVCNAFAMGPMTPVVDTDASAWRETFEVNVIGALNVTVAATPHLAAAPDGSVVMINTQAGAAQPAAARPVRRVEGSDAERRRGRSPRSSVQRGIRVNSIVPGHIWGESLAAYFETVAKRRGTTPEDVYESVARETALKRIPTAEEIADAVVFFASPLSRAVTGQSLDVNAGNWFE